MSGKPTRMLPARLMRSAITGLTVASLFFGVGVASATEPISKNPDQPLVLAGALTGTLPANGGVAYYKFVYPGNEKTATINLQVYPDDANILKDVGFNVYRSGQDKPSAMGGAQRGLVPNVSGNLIDKVGGEYVVQVFNYSPLTAIDFTIWATGLPEQPMPAAAPPKAAPAPAPAPEPAPAPAPAPAAPAPAPAAPAPAPAAPAPSTAAPTSPAPASPASETAQSFKGHLAAGSSGHFALYELSYPGDESVYTLNLQVSPDDASVLKNVGFIVYGPVKDRIYATSGAQAGIRPNVSGNLIGKDKGAYVVQVYNYDPNVAIDYELSLVVGVPENRKP